jgi:hypothetical protein
MLRGWAIACSRAEVHGLAYHAFLGTGDNHQAGGDADAHRKMAGIGDFAPGQRFDDLQSGSNSSLGLAFVRHRRHPVSVRSQDDNGMHERFAT